MKPLYIIRKINDFLLFSPSEQEVFLKKLAYEGKNRELAKKFMALKYTFFIASQLYDYEIISLGYNCLPHTLSIHSGLKMANYVFNTERNFFDLCVCGSYIDSVIALLESDAELLVDSVRTLQDGSKMFVSERFNMRFNHDDASKFTLQEFNCILKKRLKIFKHKAMQGNKLFLYFEDKNNFTFGNIKDILQKFNSSNKVLHMQDADVESEAEGILLKKPFSDYIWYNIPCGCSESGYEYLYQFASQVFAFISSNFPQKKINPQLIDNILLKSKFSGLEIFNARANLSIELT